MSTTIDESRTAVTLINTFDVEPHKQDELVELLERAAVEVFQYLDGFISSNISPESAGARQGCEHARSLGALAVPSRLGVWKVSPEAREAATIPALVLLACHVHHSRRCRTPCTLRRGSLSVPTSR